MAIQKRPCLTYEIERCDAPCMGYVDSEEYKLEIKKAQSFFRNKNKKIIKSLNEKMLSYAEEERFELAAQIRDNLKSIEKVLDKQAVIDSDSDINQDVFNYYGDERGTAICSLHVRSGRVIGQKKYFFPNIQIAEEDEDPREWLMTFLTQFYDSNILPEEILLSLDIGHDLRRLLKDVLKTYEEKNIEVKFSLDEMGSKLLDVSLETAKKHFMDEVNQTVLKSEALVLIQKKLHLKDFPKRIECYDISHFQGAETVASQVVFEDGVPNKDQYRKYKIKTVKGINDFESMKEVLMRRLKHDEWSEPQLIVVDGGKGQLKLACEALKAVGKEHIPIVGLAKERTQANFKDKEVEKTKERFYLPKPTEPSDFRENSEAFRILIQLRDEAHRFAISFHRQRRDKDFIPGKKK